VAVPRRTERQRLPPSLPCLVEAVNPCQGDRSHIANTVWRGQRGDVQQHARGTISRRERGETQPLAFVVHVVSPPRPRAGSYSANAAFTISWASLTMASR